MNDTSTIKHNLSALNNKIQQTALNRRRGPENIKLLAVSKKQSPALIEDAYAAGLRDFGENTVQEALHKMHKLQHLAITWHFIGPIQSNKARSIAEHFSWVHSLDRLKVAQKLSTARPPTLGSLNVCIQINIDEEESKSGILLKDLPTFSKEIMSLPNLTLRGLMALPRKSKTLATQRLPYQKLKSAQLALAKQGIILDTLSIGTSFDFEAAIIEGATLIRLGTALFGQRTT